MAVFFGVSAEVEQILDIVESGDEEPFSQANGQCWPSFKITLLCHLLARCDLNKSDKRTSKLESSCSHTFPHICSPTLSHTFSLVT